MNEVQNEKKVSTGVVVLITLLVVLLVGCISFIVYDKFIKKENNNPTVTDKDKNNEATNENNEKEKITLDINSNLIKTLIEPFNIYNNSYFYLLDEKAMNPNDENNIPNVMRFAALNSKVYDLAETKGWEKDAYKKDDVYYNLYVNAKTLEENFRKIYGNDIKYKNQSFFTDECRLTGNYDVNTGKYWGSNACGGGGFSTYYFNIYKAYQEKDLISTYWYSYEKLDSDDEMKIISHGKTIATTTESTFENDVNNLKKEGKISLYKINFKKQNDGKYYFYSGEWQ